MDSQFYGALLFTVALLSCLVVGYLIGTEECRDFLESQRPYCPPPDYVFVTMWNGSEVVGRGWRDAEVARVCG